MEPCWECDSFLKLWLDFPGEPELFAEIKEHIASCEIYQRNRAACIEELEQKGCAELVQRITT